jgi:hypothetical protein
MGVSAYANLRVGVPVKREDFYRLVTVRRACPRHEEAELSHEVSFCPRCGTRVRECGIEEPTEGCVKLAKELDVDDPMDLWDCLRDSGELSSSAAFASSESRVQPDLLCVGLASISDYQRSSGMVSRSQIEEAEAKLVCRMGVIGISGSPALYCQLYLSC